jgi:membrane protein
LFTDDAEVAGLTQRLLRLAPILASTLAFTLLYLLVPNRRIPFAHALIGGLVAAVLFELAKHGFGLYLTRFPTHQAIYGALATVPVFLIWLYITWMITLLGGELVHLIGLYRAGDVPGRGRSDHALLLAVDLLGELWRAQQVGETLSTRQLLERRGDVGEDRLEGLLMALQDARLVLYSDEGGWALARDLHAVRLYDLFRSRPFGLPAPQTTPSGQAEGEPLSSLLARVDGQLEEIMALSLDELFRQRAAAGMSEAPAERS